MPAVTADTMTLPRLSVDPASTLRTVKTVTNAPQGYEGEGFPVRRAFAGEAVVILRTLDGWDWENAKRTVFGTEPARLPESTWPSLDAWRAWAVAR